MDRHDVLPAPGDRVKSFVGNANGPERPPAPRVYAIVRYRTQRASRGRRSAARWSTEQSLILVPTDAVAFAGDRFEAGSIEDADDAARVRRRARGGPDRRC